MLELAYNLSGEPFEVPCSAVGWRVRKLKAKASPEVVYGRNGTPLVLPRDADMADLRREAREEGRYRLDAIDDRCQVVPGCPSGYVCIHPREPGPVANTEPARVLAAADLAVLEAMRINADLAQAVIENFPMVLESAAVLLQAADSAGMPRRPPPVFSVPTRRCGDDDDDARAVVSKPVDSCGVIEALLDITASVIMSVVLPGKVQNFDGVGIGSGLCAVRSDHAGGELVAGSPDGVAAPSSSSVGSDLSFSAVATHSLPVVEVVAGDADAAEDLPHRGCPSSGVSSA
jgi:hypothetical protein